MVIFESRAHRRARGLWALNLGLILVFCGCKKAPVPQSEIASPTPEQLAMPPAQREATFPLKDDAALNRLIDQRYGSSDSQQAKELKQLVSQLGALSVAENKLAELHRKTMVVSAPPDFTPKDADRKVQLRIVLEKSKIRVGERLRFRLEMTNIGRKELLYRESRSSLFVKNASLHNSYDMLFRLTDPRGKRIEMLSAPIPSDFNGARKSEIEYLPNGMPENEKEKWLIETNALGQAHATFKVKLLPGETLHSIGDDDSPIENFRTLFSESEFDKPGVYHLQVELDDRPKPLSEGYVKALIESGETLDQIQSEHDQRLKDALGPVASNDVQFEVTR
jgi:hypothetical protein